MQLKEKLRLIKCIQFNNKNEPPDFLTDNKILNQCRRILGVDQELTSNMLVYALNTTYKDILNDIEKGELLAVGFYDLIGDGDKLSNKI